MEVHDGNATDTLDRIRDGGGNLVLLAHQRVTEIKKALDAGRFEEAYACTSSLQEKLSHLAGAEARLALLAEASIVRAGEMSLGMIVPEAGQLTAIEPCSNCGHDDCENVTLSFENGQSITVERDEEMLVAG